MTVLLILSSFAVTTLSVSAAEYSNDGFSVNNETHFIEDFSTNSYNMSVTVKAKTEGTAAGNSATSHKLKLTQNTNSTQGSTGTAITVQDPTGAQRNVLKVEACDELGTRNRIDTNPAFAKRIAGIQYADVELYVPSEQIDKGANTYIYICAAAGTFSTPDIYLCGEEYIIADNDKNKAKRIKEFPKDKWFTVRLTLDYFAGKGYATIIDGDSETIVQTVNLDNNMKTKGLTNVYVDGGSAKKHFYIGSIHYWQKGSEASVEHFVNSTYSKINVSTQNNISYFKTSSKNSPSSEGGAWFIGIAGGGGYSASSPSSLVLSTKDNSYRGDITIASIDMFFNGASRVEGEKLSVYAETYAYSTKARTKYGDAINIQKDKVWYGSDSAIPSNATTLPQSQWFTLRVVYNHNTHYYRYELVYDDNTVKLLGSGYASAEDIATLGEYGVCGLTMTYDKVAGTSVPTANTAYIYIDNISIKNISLDTLEYDADSAIASINYQAHLDTVAMGKLLLAQYSAGGELISLQTAVPEFAQNSTKATAQFSKADGATDAKLMYWADATDTLMPLFASK